MSLTEIKGDLFTTSIPQLAHCVSADFHMGAGIAVKFKQMYGRVDELLAQNVRTGGVAVLYEDSQTVYYLVTKSRYYHKPSMTTLRSSLEQLRDLMLQNQQYQLAIPLIGCGLDRLKWHKVRQLVKDILVQSDIDVTVYKL